MSISVSAASAPTHLVAAALLLTLECFSDEARSQTPLATMPSIATWAWTGGLVSFPEAIDLSPDGRMLIAGYAFGRIIVWNVEKGTPATVIRETENQILYAGWLADGRRAITADKNNVVVWDTATGRRSVGFSLPDTEIAGVAIAPNSPSLVLGTADKRLQKWDLDNGSLIWTQGEKEQFATFATIGAVAFSSDGKLLAEGGQRYLRLRDAETGDVIATLDNGGSYNWAVAFTPDNRLLVSVVAGRIHIWDVAQKKETAVLTAPADLLDGAHLRAAFFPNGTHLAVVNRSKNVVSVVSIARSEFVAVWYSRSAWPLRAAISPDRQRAYVGLSNGDIEVLDLGGVR